MSRIWLVLIGAALAAWAASLLEIAGFWGLAARIITG